MVTIAAIAEQLSSHKHLRVVTNNYQAAHILAQFDGVETWLPRSQMMAMLWYLLAHQLWGDESYLREAEALSDTLCS